MNKRNRKIEKGITLIALVVTVIVLLILAGVSISMLTGENGILTKAIEAKEKNKSSEEDEKVRLAIASARTNTGAFDMDLLKAELNRLGFSYIENPDGSIEVTTSGTEFTITSTGEVTEIETNGQPIPRYTVSYNGNGANAGSSIPTDTREYKEKATVVIDFSIIPERTGYAFVGWSITADATEAEYVQGGTESFKMPKGDTTLYAVWQAMSPLYSQISTSNYGDTVNYTANGVSSWKVFLKDSSNNVYIIPSDVVPNSGYVGPNEAGDYRVYGGSSSDEFLTWLKTTGNFSAYANGSSNGSNISGLTAVGAPTVSQFLASYNGKKGTNISRTGLLM